MLDANQPGFVSQNAVRTATAVLATVAGILLMPAAATADAPPPQIRLGEDRHVDDLSRVTALLEVNGHLKIRPDGKEVTELPLEVTGKFLYDERLLEITSGAPARESGRSVRHYRRAEALFKVGQGRQRHSRLPDDQRLIVVHRKQGATTIVSLTGPLAREHLELVDIPGNSLLVGSLLPGQSVQLGAAWQISADAFSSLLGWEVVDRCEIEATLTGIEGNSATVELAGTATGQVRGVSSEVKLKAKCLFDIERHRIRWLGMALREKRDIGLVEPGFELTAKLQMVIAPLDDSPPLSDQNLAGLALEPDAGSRLLKVQSNYAGCRLLADRRWFVSSDAHEVTILRLVDAGKLTAQCNITSLPDLAAGKHVSLEQFQQDIQKALGKNLGQLIEASQSRTPEGLRLLRVSAAGTVSDVAVQWIYYLVSDEKGRRTVLVFTLDEEAVERFAAADQLLVTSLEFIDRPEPAPPELTERPRGETTTE